MSRAFVKEDIEIPDRPSLRRSSSGLPPGALNLMAAGEAGIGHDRGASCVSVMVAILNGISDEACYADARNLFRWRWGMAAKR